MRQQFSKLWARWRSFFDCALEVINPGVLEGNSLTESFFLDFTRRVKQAYEYAPPGKITLVTADLDSCGNWLVIQFNLAGASRKLDEIGIRWSGDEVTVDFLPGGTTTNSVCFVDDYGLRWVMLDCSRTCLIPSINREKKDIERIVECVYAIAQYYKPQLRFLIGDSAKVRLVAAQKFIRTDKNASD